MRKLTLQLIQQLIQQATVELLSKSDHSIVFTVTFPDGDFKCSCLPQLTLAKGREILAKSNHDLVSEVLVWTEGLITTGKREASLDEILQRPYLVDRIARKYREALLVRLVSLKLLGITRQLYEYVKRRN